MPIHREGQLELRADAVHGRDEHGLAVLLHVEREEAAEAADLAQHLAAVGGGQQRGERALDPVAEIDVNARGGVGFLLHFRRRRESRTGADETEKTTMLLLQLFRFLAIFCGPMIGTDRALKACPSDA